LKKLVSYSRDLLPLDPRRQSPQDGFANPQHLPLQRIRNRFALHAHPSTIRRRDVIQFVPRQAPLLPTAAGAILLLSGN
jgi:hypothetical protein